MTALKREYDTVELVRKHTFFGWFHDDIYISTAISAMETAETSFFTRVKIAVRVARCQRAICGLLWITVFLTATELYIKRRWDGTANIWTYGQMAALVLTAPAMLEVFRLIVTALQKKPSEGVKSIQWPDV
ncbi:hypothetical protein K440DRAFT_638837 [Wilcoxina mikolae CBS 423.85]|nr:hypothetical protein K440DRAFT_638837 [Wilcoxina mikolae CBS 423.85]